MNELTVEAGKSERHYWLDLLRYREPCFFLSWSDVLVRYKQRVFDIYAGIGMMLPFPVTS